jgi:hypothetical protein
MEMQSLQILMHSSIVFLISLLCGFPYGVALVRKESEEKIRAWKLAHTSLAIGATTNFAIAGVLSFLQIQETAKWVIAVSFIASAYGFTFSLLLEPFFGERGLSWSGNSANKVIYFGNSVGALGSLVGAVALVYAAYLSLLRAGV